MQKFAKFMTENKLDIQDAQRIRDRINAKKLYLGILYSNCWILRTKKIKKKENETPYFRWIKIRMIMDLSETMQTIRE